MILEVHFGTCSLYRWNLWLLSLRRKVLVAKSQVLCFIVFLQWVKATNLFHYYLRRIISCPTFSPCLVFHHLQNPFCHVSWSSLRTCWSLIMQWIAKISLSKESYFLISVSSYAACIVFSPRKMRLRGIPFPFSFIPVSGNAPCPPKKYCEFAGVNLLWYWLRIGLVKLWHVTFFSP